MNPPDYTEPKDMMICLIHIGDGATAAHRGTQMKQLLMACACMLMAGAAAGQVFECVDAKGYKEYAQFCAPGTVRQTQVQRSVPAATGSTDAVPAEKSITELNAEFLKRNLERQEAEAKAAKDQSEAEQVQRNCDLAQGQLRALQDGQRIAKFDPVSGERYYVDDDALPAEIEAAQKSADSWCKR